MSGDAERNLRATARDLLKTPLARVPRQMERVCLILLNTNRSYRLNCGNAPILRAVKVAELFHGFGYETFFMMNPHHAMFDEYFSLVLQRTSEHVFFANIGQGGGESGTESTIVFDDEALEDVEFSQLVNQNSPASLRVTLFSDFSYEGSIFERKDAFDHHVVAITCVADDSKFVQGPESFVALFVREVANRNQINNQQLFDALRIVIKRHGMRLSVIGDQQMLMEPVAVFRPLPERNELIL